MFGFGKGRRGHDDIVGAIRPDLSRESLGVGPDFPGIAPNPVLSRVARQRNRELREGALAIGTLVDWREVSSDGSPRVALMLDVDAPGGSTFRGIADETLTITELTRLQPGQTFPVRFRPAHADHYVALARDADPADVQRVRDLIGPR